MTTLALQELSDPFMADVLYNGVVVAHITERKPTDMFWHSYRITPSNEAGAKLITDDELWDGCQFYFRDPKSGHLCTTGIVGGDRPFIRDNTILLRSLYFGPAETVKEPERNA